MISWGALPAGTVIPFPFDTFAGATGASITITGLAVTDIEVYKGTSMTQRASDAGYVLMDTDGIDLDGVTGIQGFSIDTGDNTDAGFYAVGSLFWVVVSAITIDSQTVNFVAGTFRLLAAEHTAGYPVITIKDGAGTGEINTNGGKVVGVELVDVLTTYTGDTPQTGDSFARIGATGSGLTTLASQASVNTIDDFLDTEVAAILAAVDTEVASLIVTAAAILALLDDARGEPGQGSPPVNPDVVTKIDYLYKAWRNRSTQTASEFALYADDATTKDHEAPVTDDGVTFDRGEMRTGA